MQTGPNVRKQALFALLLLPLASCNYAARCEGVLCNPLNALVFLARPLGLPDTGQTQCYDAAGTVTACAGTGQDGAYALPFPYVLYNTVNEGNVGQLLGLDLLWQRCSYGKSGGACTGTAVSSVTRTQAFNICTGVAVGDRAWRVPSAREFHLLTYYGDSSVALAQNFFPNSPAGTNVYHWTSTAPVATPANTLFMSTRYGFLASQSNALAVDTHVRCVAGPVQSAPSYVRSDETEPVVTDQSTGLTWMLCALKAGGVADTTASCTGPAPANIAQASALVFCESLTYAGATDWRLPNIRELYSLTDLTVTTNPAINSSAFPPNPSATIYWSSTIDISAPLNAYGVDVSDGSTGQYVRTATIGDVRCVRGP